MRKRSKRKVIKIVFYGCCGGNCSIYASQYEAEEAAEEYSRQAGYSCEAYLCDGNKHLSPATGVPLARWHVRWKYESQASHFSD